METNLQKLTSLLCEVEEVKKDIIELRKWFQFSYKTIVDIENEIILSQVWEIVWFQFDNPDMDYYCWWEYISQIIVKEPNYMDNNWWIFVKEIEAYNDEIEKSLTDCYDNFKIIWNPLQDYHLRMYLEKKDIDIFEIKWLLLDWTNFKTFNKMPIICRLEPKLLYQQNEEILWKIFNFLIDRKND